MMKDTLTAEVKCPSAPPQEPTGVSQLASQIQQQIRRETSGRIHNLTVAVTGTHIVLEGFCSTFHCFQLAQHAAMRLAHDLLIDNRIEVL